MWQRGFAPQRTERSRRSVTSVSTEWRCVRLSPLALVMCILLFEQIWHLRTVGLCCWRTMCGIGNPTRAPACTTVPPKSGAALVRTWS